MNGRQLDGFACARCGAEPRTMVPVGHGPRGQLFECSRHHKVVTVERQGGYAARCVIEVDGVPTLCGITFGGFASRTEARAALTHEYAPDVGQDIEGEDSNPIEGEEIMTTVQDHPDIHPDIARIFTEIDECPPDNFTYLKPGDRFYCEPVARVEVRATEVRDAEVLRTRLDGSEWALDVNWFAAWYTLDGQQVPRESVPNLLDLTDGKGVRSSIHATPNAVARIGDYLLVSRGQYFAFREITIDDTPGFEFITDAEWKKEREAAKDRYLAAHPEIEAAKPVWADRCHVDAIHNDGVEFTYDLSIGAGTAAVSVEIENGVWIPSEDPRPYVYVNFEKHADGADLRALAADVLAIAERLEANA